MSKTKKRNQAKEDKPIDSQLRLEVGGFYRTRRGKVVGPLSAFHGMGSYGLPFIDDETGRLYFRNGGLGLANGKKSPHDLVEAVAVVKEHRAHMEAAVAFGGLSEAGGTYLSKKEAAALGKLLKAIEDNINKCYALMKKEK